MSDECWTFCCLCCACFGIFGHEGCMDCCFPAKGKEDEEAAKAARVKEYELFTQAQPASHPPPSTKAITSDTVAVNGAADQSFGEDRITEHENKLRRKRLLMEDMKVADVEVVQAQAPMPGASLVQPAVATPHPEKLPEVLPAKEEAKFDG